MYMFIPCKIDTEVAELHARIHVQNMIIQLKTMIFVKLLGKYHRTGISERGTALLFIRENNS